MPDTGSNGYLHVNPDGTVVVPSNLSPEGLILAGDLVTQTDLDNAVAGLADTTYVDTSITTLSDDVVHGAGMQISGQYTVAISGAGGQDTILQVDDGPYGELGWTNWVVLGHIAPNAICVVDGPEITNNGDGTLKFTFFSMSSGPQVIDATFFFFFVGIP